MKWVIYDFRLGYGIEPSEEEDDNLQAWIRDYLYKPGMEKHWKVLIHTERLLILEDTTDGLTRGCLYIEIRKDLLR